MGRSKVFRDEGSVTKNEYGEIKRRKRRQDLVGQEGLLKRKVITPMKVSHRTQIEISPESIKQNTH